MRRAALALALLCALPLVAQDPGAAYTLGTYAVRLDSQAGGINYSTMPAPSGCASGYVPYFDTSLSLVCSPTVWNPATRSLDVTDGRVQAGNLRAIPLPASGAVTVEPKLSPIGGITVDGGSALVDGDALSVGDGVGVVPIEFDAAPGDGTTGGAVPIIFDGTETATQIRDAVKAILDASGRDWTTSNQGPDGIGLVRATPGASGGAITEAVADAGFTVNDWTAPTAATPYTYSLQACYADGTCNAAGAASSTSAGVLTLSGYNLNRLSWSAVSGAASYNIRRDVGGATQGVIWTGTALTVDDTGLAGDGSAKPTADGTGRITSGALTSGRVAIVGTEGRIEDDAGLTFDGATNALTVGGTVSAKQSADTATLGAELLLNPSFATDLTNWSGTNWAWEAGADGQARHTAGSTAALAQTITPTNGTIYQISFTITGRTAGTISVYLGAVQLNNGGTTTWTASLTGATLVAGTSAATTFEIRPSTDFNGAITAVSMKQVTLGSYPVSFIAYDAAGQSAYEGRGSYAAGSVAIGPNALATNTLGINSTAMGYQALRANTVGSANTAFGYQALLQNSTANQNIGIGYRAMFGMAVGSFNIAIGSTAMNSNVAGIGNIAIGYQTGYSSTSSGNTLIGYQTGYFTGATPSATNALTTGANTTFVGYRAGLGSATQRTNATALGSGAYVDADNTVVLGNAAVTDVLAGSASQATIKGANLTLPADAAEIKLGAASDTILTRPAAATVQLGAAASATPIAQTLQAQGSRGGTDTNVAGAQFTIQSGAGTGSATGSSIMLKTPDSTTSGTDAQAYVTRLQINNAGIYATRSVSPGTTDVIDVGANGLSWRSAYLARATLGSKSKALTDGSATAFATVALADGAMTAGEVIYRVTATITGQKQVISGRVRYSAVREGTTYDADVAEVGTQTTSVTTGTLTGSITVAAAGGLLTFYANFDSDQTAPTVTLNYRFDSTDTISMTPL